MVRGSVLTLSGARMTAQLAGDRSEMALPDDKAPYTSKQAILEANRCLYCADAPCTKACPSDINIPEFIRRIATGNTRGSARTIFESNILGMSCARVCPVEVLCVGDCVHNKDGVPPIQIGKLQGFATDQAVREGWRFFEAGPATGKHVALVGAGPASLACAHELRRFGHRCTIFEKQALPGGLNRSGVAAYKMKSDAALQEAEWVLGIGGIELRTGVTVGTDVTLESLEQSHDAVFFGAGLGDDTKLAIPGENLTGIFGAVEWIRAMKGGKVDLSRVRRALVIGGGNTAIDGVRQLRGLGVPHVTMVYRGSKEKMSGYAHEWKAALAAGATAEWNVIPLAFFGSGRVERVRCARGDAQKRPIAGTEFAIDADLVLVAIGQATLGSMLAGLGGIAIEKGCVVTAAGGATGRAKWFAGGDCRNGGKEVVNAAAEGKAAARAINAFLGGGARA